MKARKVVQRLALLTVIGGMMLSALPAKAGVSPVIPDKPNDIVDIFKHTQNSFRPSTSPFVSPWPQYQYDCQPNSIGPLEQVACDAVDITSSQVISDPATQTLKFILKTKANVLPHGSPITSIPAPFSGINYAVYFATSMQESPHVVGIECSGGADQETNTIRDDLTVGSGGTRTGVEITYEPNSTCAAALNATDESKGIASRGNVDVLSRENVMSVVHPRSDGWLAFVEVSMERAANGAKRLDGKGTVQCAGGAPVCIDYDASIGDYEGYSGVSRSNSLLDFSDATIGKTSFTFSGNAITLTIPWNPTTINTEGDLLIDDERSFPWKLGQPGATITQMTAETTGVVGVGANSVPQINAVCLDSTDNLVPESVEPIRTVGATEGQVNRTLGNTTDDVQDAAGIGSPEDDGIYLHGNGSTDQGDCIRGITGLLTLLDWTDNTFELRIYPRNPGYLPSPTGYDCRYPIGRHPLAIVLVANVTLGAMSSPSLDINTSPYDKPYTVKVFAAGQNPVTQGGPVLPNPPEVLPQGLIGKNKPCGYIYHAPGIHYFDQFADIPM